MTHHDHGNKWQWETVIAAAIVVIGVALRMVDLSIPDFATDESQAALKTSAAWTPLGMQIFVLARALFGNEIVVVRSVSLLFGVLFLPMLYLLARHYVDRRTSLLIVAIAAIFPGHVLFSRLAYLSVQLSFWWTLTLLGFLKARVSHSKLWLFVLFIASVAATMTKTQGFLLPLLLIIGTLIEGHRSRTLFTTLLLSLIPVTLYLLTHPGIAATLLLSDEEAHGVSDFTVRVVTLFRTWWHVLGLFLIVVAASLREIRTFDWPFWTLLALGSIIGIFLGPGHQYYTTHLVLFSLPMGVALARLLPAFRHVSLVILLVITLALLGPSPWTHDLYRSEGYWNTHAGTINDILKDEARVTVLGNAGHHIRWYVEPRVLVGKNLKEPYPTEMLLLLKDRTYEEQPGTVLYEDERVVVLKRGK